MWKVLLQYIVWKVLLQCILSPCKTFPYHAIYTSYYSLHVTCCISGAIYTSYYSMHVTCCISGAIYTSYYSMHVTCCISDLCYCYIMWCMIDKFFFNMFNILYVLSFSFSLIPFLSNLHFALHQFCYWKDIISYNWISWAVEFISEICCQIKQHPLFAS